MIHMMEPNCFVVPPMNHVNPVNPVQLPSQFADRIGLRWLCRFTI
jgi:hypothetical protein